MWGHDSTISSRRCDGLGRIHQHLQMVGFPLYCHVSFGGCIFLSFQPSKIHHNTSRGCLKHLCWCWHQSINHLLWCCFLQKTAAKNPPFWGVKGRIVESSALVSLGCWTRAFFSFWSVWVSIRKIASSVVMISQPFCSQIRLEDDPALPGPDSPVEMVRWSDLEQWEYAWGSLTP